MQAAQFLREEFEKMHQYLRDEEASLMSELKQEEEEKTQRMKEKTDRISNDIQMLTTRIRETEEAMGLNDFLFLKVIPVHQEPGCFTDVVCIHLV